MYNLEKRGELVPKILIADDAKFMRKIIKEILNKNGYNDIIEACDGYEAVELYKEHNPSLVLVDMIMPNKNGLSALIDIMEYDKNANVVICSTDRKNVQVLEALNNGSKGYILKPFTEEIIMENVNRILKDKEKKQD